MNAFKAGLLAVLGLLAVVGAGVFLGRATEAVADTSAPREFNTEHYRIRVTPVATGLNQPWALAFLPDGRMLVTEKPGTLRVVTRDGKLSAPVKGVPAAQMVGQGGLLDVALDPDYATNRLIYLSYTEAGEGDLNGTAVSRGKLDPDKLVLSDVQLVWRQLPKLKGGHHFGSRLVFARDGRLFITAGERNQRQHAQELDHAQGKIVRVERDGRIPADNPFVGKPGVLPEIWSYGHRNPQGAALNPATGELWADEHGPRGGDELNIVRAGRNYGWPVITYGREYSGPAIGEGGAKEGMEQPVTYWVPSFGPSGLAFYTGDVYPKWKGSAFVGALAGAQLVRVVLDGDKKVGEERLFTDIGERIRDVRQGPDGKLWLLTDSTNGRLLRLDLAQP